MNYQELKLKRSKSIDEFPIRFAFNNNQMDEIMEEWQVEKKDICSVGMGGFVRKGDAEPFMKLMIDNAQELETALLDDEFLTDALEYELGNHEYSYTYDSTDTLESLGLEPGNLTDQQALCLKEAKALYFSTAEL